MSESNRLMSIDTETTGLSHEEGDRIIEIGVVEMNGLTPTGRTFRYLLDPEDRQIAAGAYEAHGISNEMLVGKPVFADVVDEFLEFIGDAPSIIYNAPFDVGFLNAELKRLGREPLATEIIDVLPIVQKRFPRSRLTLDAVARKLGVDVSHRELHGALIDADILSNVYRRLVQQSELAIAAVATASQPAVRGVVVEKKPILRANGTGVRTLPHVESTYTLFNSSMQPSDIPGIAKKAGYEAVALVDRNTTAGAMSFAAAARKAEMKGIVGVALPISSSGGRTITLYARNAEGWRNIQTLVTIANIQREGAGLTSEDLRAHAEGVAATSGGSDGALAHVLRIKGAETAVKTARFLANLYAGAFAVEITRHGGVPDRVVEAGLVAIAHELGVPTIGTVITRAAPGDSDLVEVLRAIRDKQSYQADLNDQEETRTPDQMADLFSDLPVAVDNADWISTLCDFLPAKASPMLPRFDAGDGRSEEEIITQLAREGFERHLRDVPADQRDEYEKRFDYEIELITRLKFSGYFLIVADFIGWAKTQNIPIGPGRGSGAGSLVAWCLGITGLDPIKLKLLFERFINPDRVSLPDFDIDICEERRVEVVRYVRDRYGADRVVAIGSYGTIGAKASIKDIGRVLGLPYGQTDRISKLIPDEGLTDQVIASEEMQALLTTPATREAFALARRMTGLVRSRTKHAAGIVIADRPVTDITALDVDSDDKEQAVTQYDMKPVEDAGLVKFDFLALGALTIIERTRTNLERLGVSIDPWKAPLDDAATYQELTRGNTMGVFQMESSGITRAAREIRIDNFEDIVALVALYRPGPMEYIPLYAKRKKGLEPFGTPHPLLDDITRDTFGILVYQEQVMKAAQVLAGYTLGQADLLRRAMGKKIQAEMDAQRATFIEGCMKTNGIGPQQAEALFDIIDKFAGYGFNRSHAAAYALIAYITAWLRTNHTAAFMAAALEDAAGGADKERPKAMAQEAKRHGIQLKPPALGEDGRHFVAEDDETVRWSLSGIAGIGRAVVDAIVREVAVRPFADITDFVMRVGDVVNRSHATALANAGVFDEMVGDRVSAINAMRRGFDGIANDAKAKREGQQNLFGEGLRVETGSDEIDEKEVLALERSVLGLSLSAHPLDSSLTTMKSQGILSPTEADAVVEHLPVTVAMHVDEVKMGKNRNAWMTVRGSDENVTLSMGCQEDVVGAHHLQTGEIVVVRASATVRGGERMVRIDEVVGPLQRLDGAIVDVHVNDRVSRPELRRVIGAAAAGPDRVSIIQNERVERTPAVVTADDAFLDAVRALDGVDFVGV